jgi:hypothetical protein
VFGVRWQGVQARIFDMASNGAMADNLTTKFGEPSRVIYRAYDFVRPQVENEVKDLVNKVMRQTNNAMRIK